MTFAGSTAAVIGQLSSGQVLFFSSANLPVGVTSTRDLPEWELGQFSSFTNPDGTASRAYWYPNTHGSAPYTDADYGVKLDANPVSGNAVLWTKITDGYSSSLPQHAAQLWRNYDWAADPLPFDGYYSWWMRFEQEIAFDNDTGGGAPYGFTNHWQLYSNGPSTNTGPFVTMGAGRNTLHDSYFRWRFNLDDLGLLELTQLIDEPVPVGQWMFIECRVKASTGSDGRWECWQDGRKVLDYTGPTHNTGVTQFGVSWGNYGSKQIPSDPVVVFDDIAITTVPVLPLIQAAEAGDGRRVTLIGGDGVRRVLACSDEPMQLKLNATAWGLTSYALGTRPVGEIPGERLQTVRALPRVFSLPVQIEGDTEAEIDERLSWLGEVLDPGREIRVQYRRPDGTEREISALYQYGADAVSATDQAGHLQRHVTVPLVMKALWPFWRPVANPVVTEGPTEFDDGRAAGSNLVTLMNGGDVACWPEFTVTGYAEAIEVLSLTTGKLWRVRRILAVGDVLRIDTDPRNLGVYINDSPDYTVMDQLSQLNEWTLEPGENVLLLRANTATGAEPIGGFTIRWRPQFSSC